MTSTYDIEEQRVIDRIRCIVFREARDAGATFICEIRKSDNMSDLPHPLLKNDVVCSEKIQRLAVVSPLLKQDSS